MVESDVKTKLALDWEFSTKTYKGRCRLAKDETRVQAIFRMTKAKEFPDVCQIEKWFQHRAETEEWTAEELAENCASYWQMDVELLMTAASHGPIKVRVQC